MTEYVLVHTRMADNLGPLDEILLVHKNRPAWQKNRLNLVGGKVEPGETPLQAAVRELKEETGLEPWEGRPQLYCGVIYGNESTIHCFRLDVYIDEARRLKPQDGETEKVEWFTFERAFADQRLMPNIQCSVPLMHAGVTGWVINDKKSSLASENHQIELVLPIGKPFENI